VQRPLEIRGVFTAGTLCLPWFNYTIKEKMMKELKILIVDDEERFLATTKKLLSKNGYEALTAQSGKDALELIERHMIHVVILDVKMPVMDGIETLREIKKRFPLVEVIMLTGHATVESAVDGLKSGATDYLMKPTDVEELIKKAEEAFEKRKQLEEKIRMAQAKKIMKSPRNIIKESST